MQHVVAVIPARGGSKGIPRKNLQDVGGLPLVSRALGVAVAAQLVTRVVLSTDDDEIAEAAQRIGPEVKIIRRPAHLADDRAPTIPVLQHALEQLAAEGERFDGLVLLEPTSPFRTPEIVDLCVEKLFTGSTRTVLTVTQLERNPRYIFAVDGDQATPFVKDPPVLFSRRQDFAHLKRLNGCVYATRTEEVLAGRLVVEPVKVVEMTAEASINIDTPFDLMIARAMARTLGFEHLPLV